MSALRDHDRVRDAAARAEESAVARLVRSLPAALARPIDGASLTVFRVAFGGLLVVAALRFFAHGWIHAYYEVPKYFFPYHGLEWIRPWPAPFMRVHYAVMALAALGVATRTLYRPSAAVLFATFTYAHLCDKTNYLNHYYLVSLLAWLAIFLPLDRGWRRPVPAWALYLVRFQIGVVYFFGGIAKLEKDWLVHAQPLRTWLLANTEVPVVGRLFAERGVAYAMSYGGAAFDLSVAFLLLFRRTRLVAYLALLFFHGLTGRLFQLGLFPWIMASSALVFFPPSWPRDLVRRTPLGRTRAFRDADLALSLAVRTENARAPRRPTRDTRLALAFAAIHVVVQLLLPLRHWLYPGNLLWTEEGFRFAWNVMLIEKNGACELTITDPDSGQTWVSDGSEYLTRYQRKMAATQPDMLLRFARIAADDFRARGYPHVRVSASSDVSLNGRRPRPLVDPTVDLARERDGFAPKRWITPFVDEPPQW